MKRINDLIAHKYLFILSPKLYKLFWKRKLFINKDLSTLKENNLIEREILLLPYLVNNSSVYFDIGSNIGIYLFWAEKFGISKAYGFEPIPILFNKLKKIFNQYQIENIAISSLKGECSLRIPISSKSNNEAKASIIQDNFANNFEEIIVSTETLDNYCKTNLIYPDFIKIDVEGAEGYVIEGAKDTIEKQRPILLIEIELRHNNKAKEIFSSFNEKNFRCLHFDKTKTKLVEYTNINDIQKPSLIETSEYVNNFIFIPNEKVEIINNLLKIKL